MATNIDIKSEWSTAIGKMFIAFGSIEHICIVYLKNSTSISHKVIDTDTFSKRVNRILKHLKKNIDQQSIKFSTILKEVKLLSKKRNLIAHNPLLLEVFTFSDGTSHKREFIASSRNPFERIQLSELKALSERAHVLSSEAYNCCVNLLS